MAHDPLDTMRRFRALHDGPKAFLIANAWDVGSARVLAGLGYSAIATSSGAFANTLGRHDGRVTRDEVMAHCRALAATTDVPVSADLENGFGDTPEEVVKTISAACQTGLAGGSIEDSTGRPDQPVYDLSLATERIAAAVQCARQLAEPFVVTARAENFICGRPDLGDTIARLRAYEKAGADVLFAPGLPDLESIRAVCREIKKPLNFMVGIKGKSFSVAELQDAGVRRISLSTSLYRAAMTGLVNAAREAHDSGTFNYLDHLVPSATIGAFMQK